MKRILLKNMFITITAAMILAEGAIAADTEIHSECTDASRKCMIVAAQAYLYGISYHDGSKVPFAPQVHRTGQGVGSTETAAQARGGVSDEIPMRGASNTRFFVDEEKGAVIYFTLLHVNVTSETAARLQSAALKPGPMTVHLAERIKVEKGLITEVEYIAHNEDGTDNAGSGWPDD